MKREQFKDMQTIAENMELQNWMQEGAPIKVHVYFDPKTGIGYQAQIPSQGNMYRHTHTPERSDDILEYGSWKKLEQ